MQESLRAEFRSEGARVNEGAPACHIFGSIPVNQVRGDFRITGKNLDIETDCMFHLSRSTFPMSYKNFHLENSILI